MLPRISRWPLRTPRAFGLFSLSVVLFLAGCGDDDDDVLDAIDQVPTVAPIEAVVKAAVPLSYAASIAMAAVTGTTYPHVATSNTCSSYPCVASLIITVQPGSLPVALDGIADNGEILIAGLWSSANQAILTVVFDDLRGGNHFQSIRKISTVPVSRQNGAITLVYSTLDIDIDSEPEASIDLSDAEIQAEYDRLDQEVHMDPEVNISMDTWVVEAQSGGTPPDLSDDRYFIVGGGQYFEAAPGAVSVLQIGVVGLEVTPTCVLNPTDGNAMLQEVRIDPGSRSTWPVLGQALIEFRPACDGTARVLLGTGSFFLISGDDIDLGFGD